jgi:transposase InsO family protein
MTAELTLDALEQALWARKVKGNLIHRRRPWRSLDAVEYVTLDFDDWFNNRCLLEPIGNNPPAEFAKA